MDFLLALQIPPPDVNFGLLLPELIICVVGVVVMLLDAFARPSQRWVTGGLSLAGLAAATVASLWMWVNWTNSPPRGFHDMVVLDELRLSFTLIFLLVSALTVLISMVWVEQERLPAGEFHSLLLFATAGMMLMASGNDLVIIFLGLEILSIATYVMCGFRRADLRSNESALKYFILGSFSSAFLLYGIALVYGGSGTTNISQLASVISTGPARYPALLFAGAA
ncbi:MAG TPA: proton-conducting transporter membrane subunit, partial [Pyrinomonadaceae bacterium]|nr:proton-conducting transporter membrane subunit [Pyrinomonadaceae bacterium]